MQRTQASKGDTRFKYEIHSHKGSYVSIEDKGRAFTKSLFASPNPHKGKLVLIKNSPPRRG
jgi:hypothetical protein